MNIHDVKASAVSDIMQRRIDEFLQRAEQCEQDAAATGDELVREQFLITAKQWRALADDAKAIDARNQDAPSAGPEPRA